MVISLGNLVNMFLSDVFLYRENIFQMAWCNINLHRFKFLGHLVCLYLYCLYPTNATFFWQFFMICVKFTVAATFHFRYQNGAMVSDSFAYRKTKSCGQHGLYVLKFILKSSACVCLAIIGTDATKIYTM